MLESIQIDGEDNSWPGRPLDYAKVKSISECTPVHEHIIITIGEGENNVVVTVSTILFQGTDFLLYGNLLIINLWTTESSQYYFLLPAFLQYPNTAIKNVAIWVRLLIIKCECVDASVAAIFFFITQNKGEDKFKPHLTQT